GSSKYSSLDLIDGGNVGGLGIAWEWVSIDERIQREHDDNPSIVNANYFQCTPILADGVLYGTTNLGQAMAIDPGTGETLWGYSSEAYKAGRPPNLGYISRGAAYKELAPDDQRIYMATSDSRLVCLDAKTGQLVKEFGDNGAADLLQGVPRVRRGRGYGHPSAPVISGDTIIVGSAITDGPIRKEVAPGQVKGFDVKTGELKWSFNMIAQSGEYGADTWEDGANAYTGNANVWTNMSVDEELGYVYLPGSTPTNDFYGGHRKGDGLFAESLVCLNAETGERVWYFQFVHHGLWDYDLPCAPNLVDLVVDGKAIKAVAQATKQGFVFVFDRVTGEPVWPIEERPVPQSTVPGEQTSPTQPFPTKPPPFIPQGVTEDMVIDFTPELKAKALEVLKAYTFGPLFTPPGLDKPLLNLPGYGGGANWPGVAVDPETGYMYIPTMNHPSVIQVGKPDPARSNFRYTRSGAPFPDVDGLPLLKPPYAEIVAMDLNKGEIAWRVTNGGDGPRDHPALKGLDLPPMGSNGRAAVLVTKTLLFATEGSGRSESATGGGRHLRAFDKHTGEELASIELPGEITGVPMTYLHEGKQYIVVAVGTNPARLVALSL
ncbi:MAG: pyrroloquinoline quinone-dependent dehydrogenase, partial [Candidatus Hydrogenedentota bacterium]